MAELTSKKDEFITESNIFQVKEELDQKTEFCVFGFIHRMEKELLSSQDSMVIASLIYNICLAFHFINYSKELKQWMCQNDIYSQHLLHTLLENDIKSMDDITAMEQFDDLIRKVRVYTFTEIKDQNGRLRIDKSMILMNDENSSVSHCQRLGS